jgi:hypothetical protein
MPVPIADSVRSSAMALALALGIGAAIVGGAGIADADTLGDTGASTSDVKSSGSAAGDRGAKNPAGSTPHVGSTHRSPPIRAPRSTDTVRRARAVFQPKPIAAKPATTVADGSTTADRSPSGRSTRGALGALRLIRREIEQFARARVAPPAVAPGVPTPDDAVATAYGDIGKWMLKADGEIANWGGRLYGGKTLLEPVNVIIVDPNSTSAAQATRKLNFAMLCAGFPAQPLHSTGFRGSIDDVTYRQQPTGPLHSYSDNFFLLPNDHGRIFGPDPVQTSTGYVWSGAFSTEELALYNGLPTHAYVSSSMARNALALRLILSGLATFGGLVRLDNSYNTATTTTGDHDGYAVVLVLR